jgi:protein SCO1/2
MRLLAALACLVLLAACHPKGAQKTGILPDVTLVDDHGKSFTLGSLKGKPVLVSFIHVGCPTVCTPLTNKFAQVADKLGPDLGSRVMLLSVTNDPDHDRPELLLKLAQDSDADRQGWLFATGTPENVDRVMHAFGLKRYRLPDGSPGHISQVFLVGSDGRQKREYQGLLVSSDEVASDVRAALAEGRRS